MFTTLLLSLVPALGAVPAPAPAAPPAAAASPAAARQDDELPDKRPEVEELLDALDEHVKQRGAEDREAVEVIGKLRAEFQRSGPKDRSAIAKAIGKCFTEKRRPLEGDVPDNRLYLASAEALGEMGPESAKVLEGWIDHKRFRDDLKLQRTLVLALGETRVDDAVDTLVKLLMHKDPSVVGAAAEALGKYDQKPSELRKEAFGELLKVMMSTKNATDADINDLIAKERWEALAAPLKTSLNKLSGQSFTDPNAFRDWWNDNKRRDWDRDA